MLVCLLLKGMKTNTNEITPPIFLHLLYIVVSAERTVNDFSSWILFLGTSGTLKILVY